MIPFRFPSWRLQVFLAMFAKIASTALVNVTVDDAVLTGAVVPQYLPSPSNWNAVINNCTGCVVKPDPSQVYNRTWHDATFIQSNGFTQVIDFTFTGSALYIFFIIANSVPGVSTLTDVQFVLDQAIVGRYTHPSLTTTDFQYNVAVYANDSIPLGQHNMMIEPVNTGSNVLILFDYLIYTMDTSTPSPSVLTLTSTLPNPLGTATATISESLFPTSSGAGAASARSAGAIAGGTVGGIAVLALIAATLLYYRRHKRRHDGQPEEGAVVDQFTLSRDAITIATPSSTPQTGSSVTKSTPRFRAGASSASVPSLDLFHSTIPSSSSAAVSSRDSAALREQVELLRDEVARLRQLQNPSPDILVMPRGPPPRYS